MIVFLATPSKQCYSCPKLLVFLELSWGNSSNDFFLAGADYGLCKNGLTSLLVLSNLFSSFQNFFKVFSLYMVPCTIFPADIFVCSLFSLFLHFNILRNLIGM